MYNHVRWRRGSPLEYIWIDGGAPVANLRSKTRICVSHSEAEWKADDWGFDGSSTGQATGDKSDCVLRPVCSVPDPLRGLGRLVMCEVLNPDGTPHSSNTRAALRDLLEAGAQEQEPVAGFEQEYTIFQGQGVCGWPERGHPVREQGPYYCGVGTNEVAGRRIADEHLSACCEAGLLISGINAEVMLGQWEFQIGPQSGCTSMPDLLTICDHLWLARWLLYRVAEKYGLHISLDCKPVPGWNGAGMHLNFSTTDMREDGGLEHIERAIKSLRAKHHEHIAVYGHGLEQRLTGLHETCDINTFKSGVGDRTASIRIPLHVAQAGRGYLEDRRPGANCDPYLAAWRLVKTVC